MQADAVRRIRHERQAIPSVLLEEMRAVVIGVGRTRLEHPALAEVQAVAGSEGARRAERLQVDQHRRGAIGRGAVPHSSSFTLVVSKVDVSRTRLNSKNNCALMQASVLFFAGDGLCIVGGFEVTLQSARSMTIGSDGNTLVLNCQP